jgi:hypothetical protein
VDEREWKDQAKRLNLNFPGQELRPESLASWYDEGDLADRDAWLISLAVRRIIRAHDYPPRSVAGLLRVVEEVRGELAREQASDAVRTCPGCATEDTPGWVEGDGGFHPCPDCRPGRHNAWAETRKQGFPEGRGSRNVMAAPFDKATGYPQGREPIR